ncbi:hypothetical protein PHMEG_00022528 [Phytophthora megakarya]|uniref:RxLR effector protein n=1 Tax=Phytophthora megakarya TaxID=4795 RepID=A0A225VJ83_9STRA|nr:hypothetical protein PHMEG_00022528 [Phytophthora megakarya]
MRFNDFLVLIVVTFVANCFSVADAKQEVTIRAIGDMWKDAFSKVKAVNAFNSPKLRSQTTPDKGVDAPKARAQTTADKDGLKFDPLNPGKVDAPKLNKDLETAMVKLSAGAKFEKLDTAPTGEWKNSFDKFKASGQLPKNIDEKQAVKITKSVAQKVAKRPSKWRNIMESALITFGAVVTALIIIGLLSMIN